jgi:hypothetical protein
MRFIKALLVVMKWLTVKDDNLNKYTCIFILKYYPFSHSLYGKHLVTNKYESSFPLEKYHKGLKLKLVRIKMLFTFTLTHEVK